MPLAKPNKNINVQAIKTEKKPSRRGGNASAANEDLRAEDSCPTTPTYGQRKDLRSRKDSVMKSEESDSDIWSSTPTSCQESGEEVEEYDRTPLTPLSSRSPTRKRSSKIRTPSRFLETGTSSVGKQSSTLRVSEWDHGSGWDDGGRTSVKKERGLGFKSVARNLTPELFATNATGTEGRYNLRPGLPFSTGSAKSAVPAAPKKRESRAKNSEDDDDLWQQRRDASLRKNRGLQNISSIDRVRALIDAIVPLDLEARLEAGPLQCIASFVKDPLQRCTNKASSPSYFDDCCLHILSKCVDGSLLIQKVEELTETIMCGIHRKSASRFLVSLRAVVAGLTSRTHDECSYPSDSTDSPSHRRRDHTALPNKNKDRRRTVHAGSESIAAQAKPKTTATIKATKPVKPSTNSRTIDFTPYLPKQRVGRLVQDILREAILKPLNSKAMNEGFVYMLWEPQNTGMIKIGYTGNLKQRIKKWNSDCKRQYEYLIRLPKIPHAFRVERLMHIELMQYGHEWECESCNKSHQEWFEVSERKVVQVFEKWYRWMVTEPYDLHARTGQWVVRRELLDEVAQLCEPLPLEEKKKARSARRRNR